MHAKLNRACITLQKYKKSIRNVFFVYVNVII